MRHSSERDCSKYFDTIVHEKLLKTILNKLELRLNEDKTENIDAFKDKFKLLRFQVGMVKSQRTGNYFPVVEPSAKSMKSVKQKIKFYTRRDMNPVPINDIVKHQLSCFDFYNV